MMKETVETMEAESLMALRVAALPKGCRECSGLNPCGVVLPLHWRACM